MRNNALLMGIAPSIPTAVHMDATGLNAAVGHNVGNLAFVHAIDQQLGGGLTRFRRLHQPKGINDASEPIAVLPCANHLSARLDMAGEAEHFTQITKPMVAIGLGAQAGISRSELPDLPDGSVKWLRDLAERAPSDAPNISVRGEFTLRVLEKYGVGSSGVALGCPTLFLSPQKDLGRQIGRAFDRPIRRVAVAAGHYKWKHMRDTERSLARLVEQTNGAYILQSPLEMLQAHRGEWDKLNDDTRRDMADTSNGSEADIVDWYRRYSAAFFDIPAWMNYLRSFDFVIGPRIHGVMLGLQAGVPGVCIAHDSRTAELCETMAVPYVLHSEVRAGVALDDLKRMFVFDDVAFDARRKELLNRYRDFLGANGLTLKSPLLVQS